MIMKDKKLLLLAAASIASIAAVSANAQTVAPGDVVEQSTAAVESAPDAAPHMDAGEIVVTAQRRSESLKRVPIAISAYNGETPKQANIMSVFDLPTLAPHRPHDNGLSSSEYSRNIRGIGTAGG